MPSTVDWTQVDTTILADLPARLDDRQLEAVTRIARLPVPPAPPGTEDHFLKCMRTLTLLPHRQEDDLSAELRLALYRRHFGRYPDAALSFLVEHATLECRFFPTPAECRAILERWTRTDEPWRAWNHARVRMLRELEARFDLAQTQLKAGEMTQEQVDALPLHWRRVLATQGLLWEGTYALRPVRLWGEAQEGQGPAVSGEQHTVTGEGAGHPHEGTGQ